MLYCVLVNSENNSLTYYVNANSPQEAQEIASQMALKYLHETDQAPDEPFKYEAFVIGRAPDLHEECHAL